MSTIEARDLTLEYKYATGQTLTRTHRVWNADLFISARVNEGRNSKKPEEMFEIRAVHPTKKA
jgi:hypothetical protein